MKCNLKFILACLLLTSTALSAQSDDLTNELMIAAGHGNVAEVKLLLSRGAKANAHDNFGFTALMFAAKSGSTNTVHLLLAEGADVNVKSKILGYTALMNAAAFGNEEMVEAILAKGAVVNERNDDGVTALTFAKQAKKSGIVKILKAHGAK